MSNFGLWRLLTQKQYGTDRCYLVVSSIVPKCIHRCQHQNVNVSCLRFTGVQVTVFRFGNHFGFGTPTLLSTEIQRGLN